MPKNQNSRYTSFRLPTLRVAKLHFLYAAILVGQVLLYHVWDVITLEAIVRRWMAIGGFLAVITVGWYIARSYRTKDTAYRLVLFALIATDIAIASFGIYTQRGMASRAVALYAIPIVVAATFRTRRAIFATATLCAVAYIVTAVSYFGWNFNEGYKAELYGEVFFYSATFFIIASLLWGLVRKKK